MIGQAELMKGARAGSQLVLWAGVAALALGMGGLVAVHPALPFVLIGGLAVVAVLARSPLHMLLAFIVVLFTRPAEFFPALSPLQLGKLSSLAALGMFGLGKVVRQDLTWAASGHNRWMILLTGAVLVSSLVGSDRPTSMATFTDVYVKILILYVLILNLVKEPRDVAMFQVVIVLVCAGLGGYALHAKITGTATIEGSRAALVGYLGDPNDLAMTLLMAAPLTLQGVMDERGFRRFLWGLAAFLVVGGVLSTQSRGGLLGMAGSGYFLLKDRVKSQLVIGVIVAFGLLLGVAAAGVSKRASGGTGGEHEGIDESAQGRLDAWGAGGRMVLARPLTGVGFSRFADNYERYVRNPVIWGKHETHNAYIKCAAETGLPGFIGYMALILRSLWVAWRVRSKLRVGTYTTSRGLFTSLVALCISTFFLSACWSWFVYILVALIAALDRVDLLGGFDGEHDGADEAGAA
jgi:putative inorganic carbon (hco3(-)) transporter